MKISDITIKSFRTTADRFDVGYARPMPDTPMLQTVLTIHTDEGVTGNYFGGGSHGDAEGLNIVDQQMILWRIKDLLVGQDPMGKTIMLTPLVKRIVNSWYNDSRRSSSTDSKMSVKWDSIDTDFGTFTFLVNYQQEQIGRANQLYFLNLDDIELRFASHEREAGEKGVKTEADSYQGLPIGIEPVETNKDSSGLVIKAYCQLVYLNPRSSGIISGLTA